MDIFKELMEEDIIQTENEVRIIFKVAVGLIVLDIILMLTKIAHPGRWLYEIISYWICPVVTGLGGFIFIFCVFKFFRFFNYYRSEPEYRNRLKPALFKTGTFIFAYIVFIFFIIVANIYIPEHIPIENWV